MPLSEQEEFELLSLERERYQEPNLRAQKPYGQRVLESAGREAGGMLELGKKIINPIKTGYDVGRGAAQTYEQAQQMQSVTQPGGVDPLAGVKALGREGIVEPAKAMGRSALKTVTSPLESFEEAPISTAMTVLPIAGKAASMAGRGIKKAAQYLSHREIQSLIKPPIKAWTYGKNPVKGIIDEGIIATSKDDLVTKIADKRSLVGQQIGGVLDDAANANKHINAQNVVKPLEDALSKAIKNPRTNRDVLNRINDARLDIMGAVDMPDGTVMYTRNLKKLPVKEAQALKQQLGEMAKYTGNVTDDTMLNKGLQGVYRSLDDKIDAIVPNVKGLNERYANLSGAYVSAKHNALVSGRKNVLGLGEMVAGTGGWVAGAHPLAGAAGIGAYKAVGSTPFKTLTAQALAKGVAPIGKKLAGAGKAVGGTNVLPTVGTGQLIREQRLPR